MSALKLFKPRRVGDITLQHGVVLAPLTRFRATKSHVSLPIVQEYYSQRSSVPGSLLITEATFIDPRAGGYGNVPGIWSGEQISAWKKITDAVHANGSFIYLQLWALGRTAEVKDLEGHPLVSASDIPSSSTSPTPRPLSVAEVEEYVQLYATAASNAVHQAGFDGVEIHAANGYLPDQFIQDVSNKRTDAYGGSIEKRVKFPLDIVKAVAAAIGPTKTGIRFSPWGRFNGMGMEDPVPTFSYLVSQLREQFPQLAYIHLVEPRDRERFFTANTKVVDEQAGRSISNDFIRDIWGERALITAGGYTRDLAIDVSEKKGDLIAFGRPYISNPDLPDRLLYDYPLAKGDRSTYYVPGSSDPTGYTSYPRYEAPVALASL